MATKKPVKKVAAKKPAPVKAKAKPAAKKVVPAKKTAKPVVKKSAAKKAPVKPGKATPKKAISKPVAKKAPIKKVVKAPTKKIAPKKPVAKKAVPVKKVAKVTTKKVVATTKTIAKTIVKKNVLKKAPIKAAKPVVPTKKPEAVKKRDEIDKVVVKPTPPVFVKKVVAKNPKDIKITPAKPVVVPKINTKSSRAYQPDFTKSVLDRQKNDPGAPIVRYSDSELFEFKELILRKLEAAKKELHYLQGLITRKDETGGDESENRYMTMEDGSLSMEREQLGQMASRQITFIDHLEKALMRIENKTYGVCRVTGKLIDKARLRAVPHATLSIEAKMSNVK